MLSLCADPTTLVTTLKDSEVLEVDLENEKVRSKKGWDQWLFPQPDGTMGCPRYTKPKPPPARKLKLKFTSKEFVPSFASKSAAPAAAAAPAPAPAAAAAPAAAPEAPAAEATEATEATDAPAAAPEE